MYMFGHIHQIDIKIKLFLKTMKSRHQTGTGIAIVYQSQRREYLLTSEKSSCLHSAPAAGHRALEPLGPDPHHNHTRQMTDEVMTDPWHHLVM